MRFPFLSLCLMGHKQHVFLCLQPPPRGMMTSCFPHPTSSSPARKLENDFQSRSHPAAVWGELNLGSKICVVRPEWAAPSPHDSAKQITSVVWARLLFLPSPFSRREKSHQVQQQELIQATAFSPFRKWGWERWWRRGCRAWCWPAELWL